MPKKGEIDYLHTLGANGLIHALNKPFSDSDCGRYLTDLGTIMMLLPAPPARLLDLGAGSGWTSCFFALRGYDVVAQDIADDMVELMERNKEKYGIDNMKSVIDDYEFLQFKDEFDCAVFYDCLHHAEDEYKALLSAYNSLKSGGILITAEPGTGHAASPDAVRAMADFGVTEKDMPPRKIIEIARTIGFRASTVYQRNFAPAPLYPLFSLNTITALIRILSGRLRVRHDCCSHFVVLTK